MLRVETARRRRLAKLLHHHLEDCIKDCMSRNLFDLHELRSTWMLHAFFHELDSLTPSKMPFEFLRLSWTPSSCTSIPVSLLRTLLLATRPAETFVTESRGVAIRAIFGTLHHVTRPTATATCSQRRPLHIWRCSNLIKMAWHTNTYQASNIGRIRAANIGINSTLQCRVVSQ